MCFFDRILFSYNESLFISPAKLQSQILPGKAGLDGSHLNLTQLILFASQAILIPVEFTIIKLGDQFI